MANDNLRQALTDAGIAPDELAGILGVDDRTVRRWLAGATPYARHRAKLARALDTTQQQLWPHLARAIPADAPVAPATAGDTVAVYAEAAAADAPSTEALIAAARERIDLLAHASHELIEQLGLAELLANAAIGGCSVRLLVSQPDHSLGPLLGTSGLEIRLSGIDERPVTHRVDEDTLVWVALTTDQDEPSPVLLHVRADRAPGLFARLAEHYQRAWETSQPIDSEADIEYYLTERDGDYPDEDEDEGESADRQPPRPDPEPPAARVAPPGATAQRRWPGRPA